MGKNQIAEVDAAGNNLTETNIAVVPWWHWHRRLYDWVIHFANTAHGATALFILSFAESSFFPVPPDVLLGPLALGAPRKWMRLISERLPATIQLGSAVFLFGRLIGLPMGVISAVRKGGFLDTIGKTLALTGLAAPTFWVSIVLIWIFAVELGWTPTSGKGGLDHMVLPVIAGGTTGIASWLRLTRTAMLDALDSEYVMYARMKGLPEWKVVWKHAFRNALIVPITSFGGVISGIITGSVVLETIFAWPGVGLLAIQSINGRDYVVIQAITMMGAVMLILGNLAVDILYAYIDPRIRYDTAN